LWKQAGAAGTIILWDGAMTFLILRAIGLFIKLRLPDDVLEVGDLGVHDEEAYPTEPLVSVGAGSPATVGSSASSPASTPVTTALAEPAPD
jgi:Amt family ammonium transporter